MFEKVPETLEMLRSKGRTAAQDECSQTNVIPKASGSYSSRTTAPSLAQTTRKSSTSSEYPQKL